jgi:PAS domain S-box-containing protein
MDMPDGQTWLEQVIDWIGDELIKIDLSSKQLLYASPKMAERLGGLTLAGSALLQALARVMPPEIVRGVELGALPSAPVEFRVTTPGSDRWLRVRARTVGLRADLVLSDVTELVLSRRAAAHAELLRQFGQRLQGDDPLATMLAEISEQLRAGLDVSVCVVTLFDDASGAVSVGHLTAAPGLSFSVQPLDREQASALLRAHGRVVQFHDLATIRELINRDQLIAAGVTSTTIAAIGPKSKPIGLVKALIVGPPRALSDEDLTLLAGVADALAAPFTRAVLSEERMRGAERLGVAEERLRAALEATALGIWEFNPITNQVTWDARCFELWEFDPSGGPQVSAALARVHVEDRPRLAEAYARAFDHSGSGAFNIEYRYQGPSGQARWIAASGRCLFDEQRRPRRFIGSLADVTARRAAEAERLASEQRYRQMIEALSEGVGVIDAVGFITFANLAYAKIFGFASPEALVGVHIETLIFPEDQAAEREKWLRHVAAGGGTVRGERRFRERDGREVWVSLASTPLWEDGVCRGTLGVLSDVTQARKLEAKLQQAQKLESLGVLAGGIAHDFNNLLVGVMGNAGLARSGVPKHSPALAAIDDIEAAAVRASELTRQLLAYAGKGRFVISRIDLRRLVEEMANLLATAIGKNVSLRFHCDEPLPPVEGDATQLRQVVMNLITNASDAIGEKGGVVTLRSSTIEVDRAYLLDFLPGEELAPGRYVALEVSDTGAGMTAETRARIFDPFFTTKFVGRGLGLAAVLGIMRAHRGAIKVYSEPGRGSTFKVVLPAAAGEADLVPAALPTPTLTTPGTTVLVVDDEVGVRKMIRRLLEAAGYVVLLAEDGLGALEAYEQNGSRIQLVVLDVTMPRMGGEETFRRLRQLDPEVRVLLTSGYSEQEATSQFAGKGLAGFIEKPFRANVLLEKVNEALAGKRR